MEGARMSQKEPQDGDRLRQTRQHLATLKAAGVEWLPKASPGPPANETPTAPPDPPASLRHEPAGNSAESAPADLDQRRHELTVLADQVKGCTRCAELASTRTQTVFGVGALGAELCFIGEAPGADEDAQGEPFVGAAGQLLNRIIAACGMKREEVYICNILKCRPPGNRQPLPDEAAHCREHLDRQLELVRPKYICCLGATAAQNLLNTTQSIGKMRGRFLEYRNIPVLCTYHPAYLLRSPEKKKDVWEDMKRLLAHMGRPVPAK
jgi:uracil-DNA glycosylase family 4